MCIELAIVFSKYQPIFVDTPKNEAVNHSSAVTSEPVSLLGEKLKFHPITLTLA